LPFAVVVIGKFSCEGESIKYNKNDGCYEGASNGAAFGAVKARIGEREGREAGDFIRSG
jgi:hypothetical protein